MIKCNLAVLLAERELKMADIIKDTSLSKTAIRGLYYNTSKGIQFETLDKICEYLKVSAGDLLVHYYFDYKITKFTLHNNNTFSCEIALTLKNKTLTGELEISTNITEYLFDDPSSNVPISMDIYIYYPKEIYEEFKKVPLLFSKEIEDELAKCTLECLSIEKPLNLDIIIDVKENDD